MPDLVWAAGVWAGRKVSSRPMAVRFASLPHALPGGRSGMSLTLRALAWINALM